MQLPVFPTLNMGRYLSEEKKGHMALLWDTLLVLLVCLFTYPTKLMNLYPGGYQVMLVLTFQILHY